jgi:hypothetical protein
MANVDVEMLDAGSSLDELGNIWHEPWAEDILTFSGGGSSKNVQISKIDHVTNIDQLETTITTAEEIH